MKVLVIDDSALMRKYLRQILEASNDTEVITARDGQDGLNKIREFNPDVVTLDINMPVMDGLTCLSHIMAESPRPVVMISSLTEKGALSTFEALELGAVDYVCKPGGTVSLNIREIDDEIRSKVLNAAGARFRTRRSHGLRKRLHRHKQERLAHRRHTERTSSIPAATGLVLIGVSTGGPATIETILTQLPENFPWPILIAQHMPARFTPVFARRLDNICDLNVRELEHPTPLTPGLVLIARGGADVILSRRSNRIMAVSTPINSKYTWHPSVDRMVSSALEHYRASDLIGVLLTGMGDDGAETMARLNREGGHTIAEAEDTAVVYGMPRELIEKGGADKVLPMEMIADTLCEWLFRITDGENQQGASAWH